MKSIIVCGSPRTGGNYLCKLLTEAGIGIGDEYAFPRFRKQKYGHIESHADYWRHLWETVSQNDVFVVKFHWTDTRIEWLKSPFVAVPPDSERVIWIYQMRNMHPQAVSWARAVETGNWFGKIEYLSIIDELTAIDYYQNIRSQNENWTAWFRDNEIVPLTITYEDLIVNPYYYVRKISRLLNGNGNI